MPLPISPADFNAVRWTRITKTLAKLTICIVAVTVVTAVLYAIAINDRPLFPALAFLFVVLIVSAVWGFRYAIFVSFLTALGFVWLLPPSGQFWLYDPRDVVALATFLVIGIFTSYFSERARRESLNAKQRRAEAVAAQQRFADLLNAVEGIVWEADADTLAFSFVSQKAERILGYPIERWLRESTFWKDRIHPDDRDWVIDSYLKATTNDSSRDFEYRMIAADGNVVWLRNRITVASEDGCAPRMRGVMIDVTLRKQAEEMIRRSERELRDVIETMPAMAWSAMPDGFNIFDSKRWTEYTGLSVEDSGGQGWEAAVHPEDLDRHGETWRASLASGQPFESEVRLRSAADGGYRWFLARAAPLRDEHGNILKWYGILTDIEDRKRAEQVLREREAKIRGLFEANIIATFIGDIEGQVIEANDAFVDMLGYDREDLAAGRVHRTRMTPPEWRERDARTRADLEAFGRVQPFEKEYWRKDGSRVPVLIGAAVFQPDRVVAFVLDLSERKRAEQALRESEEQWKAVFENNPTMYFMVDTSGAILSVNPFGADQLGFTVGELTGRPVLNLFHSEDRETIGRNAATCFERPGQTMRWEARKIRKNGEVLWVREMVRVMSIKDRPVALIVCEDITESKRVSEVLREVQMELEHATRVATMGQLTASIAHEVNQPISATITNAEAALRWLGAQPPDLEEARQALVRIAKDGNRASDVVRRIGGLVRKAPPRKDRLDINRAIREVIELTRVEAMSKGVSVQTDFAEGLPIVEADRIGLQQVMLNLIINAVEAMSGVTEGPRDLSVSSGKADPHAVLVTVRDSGPGLTPAALERLFDAFYTTKATGLGLGLSICRSIVEAHGGRLWASTNVPRGAIFEFTLPVQPYNES